MSQTKQLVFTFNLQVQFYQVGFRIWIAVICLVCLSPAMHKYHNHTYIFIPLLPTFCLHKVMLLPRLCCQYTCCFLTVCYMQSSTYQYRKCIRVEKLERKVPFEWPFCLLFFFDFVVVVHLFFLSRCYKNLY